MSKKEAPHIAKGKAGEDAAAEYIAAKGYRIVARNYRAGKGEIDIIAWAHDRLLVFFEVKTRKNDDFGGPESAISPKKRKLLLSTAGAYMDEVGYDWAVRFDVVAILLDQGGVREIRHHEDAFFS
jgi:putative endonuclease